MTMSVSVPFVFAASLAASSLSAQPLAERLKILPSPATENGIFGDSLGLHNGVAAVASKGIFTAQIPGRAGLYDTATGARLADLPMPVTPAERLVVYGCAIGPARAAVGTRVDGQPIYTETVWLFDTTDPAAPLLITQIQPSDAEFADAFGDAIAIDGTLMIVAASGDDQNGPLSGSAYLFDTATGAELAKIVADDGEAVDQFGFSVDISGDRAIVGARWESETASRAGAAYIFDLSDPANPVQTAKLLASDGAADDFFGFDVAIEGDIAVVGAIFNDEAGFDAGAAYVFDITDPAHPIETAKLIPADADPTDDFGWSVAIEGALALIGSRTDDDVFPGAGSAYLYDLSDPAAPIEITKIVPTDTEANAVFGWSAAFDGGTLLIGAAQDNAAANNAGAAYVFDVPAPPCPCDVNSDTLCDGSDFFAWVSAFGSGDPVADVNADGTVDGSDFFAWVAAFGRGC